MKENRYLIIGLGLVVAGMIGVMVVRLFFIGSFPGGMGRGMMGRMMSGGMMQGQGMMNDIMRNMEEMEKKTEFSSNGERIYYTGINSKGEAIKNSHGMQGVGCAMCHGADAKGMKMMMMDVPALRWETLTNPLGYTHPNGREHAAFTESSFKTCVLAGFDPGGNQLSTMMPRWQMSNEDLDELIDYLKII